jgi:NAD(P)-dependent dehydrogenase (short-subunit alcohol dehydrogenase family)
VRPLNDRTKIRIVSRTYVVTGNASGMGRATAHLLEKEGARVIGVDLRDADVIADLTTPEGRRAMVDGVRAAVGESLDGVIACAGVSGVTHSSEVVVRLDYFGAVATLEGLRPLLARAEAPRAATISSASATLKPSDADLVQACLDGDEEAALGFSEVDGSVAYASAKRALALWVKREAPTPAWAGEGIALNAVAPGVIDTPFAVYLVGTPELRAATLAEVPQPYGGIGKPEHVGALLAWLTSEQNGFLTGQLIAIDGGLEASLRPTQL